MTSDATDAELVGSLSTATPTQWAELERVVSALADPARPAYVWHAPEELEDGSLTFAWVHYSDEVRRLETLAHEMGIVSPLFDWSAWWKQDRYPDAGTVRSAPVADLIRVVTSIVRGDRFNEGAIAEYLDNGVLVAALARLVDELGPPASPPAAPRT